LRWRKWTSHIVAVQFAAPQPVERKALAHRRPHVCDWSLLDGESFQCSHVQLNTQARCVGQKCLPVFDPQGGENDVIIVVEMPTCSPPSSVWCWCSASMPVCWRCSIRGDRVP